MTEYEYIRLELQKEVTSKSEFIAAGNCKTYDEYKHVTGVIRGLSLAIDLIKDREQKLEDEDE
jgi:hypothetical protein